MKKRNIIIGVTTLLAFSCFGSGIATGTPGDNIADFMYYPSTGALVMDTDSDWLVSMLVEGPPALSIDKFDDGFDAETGTTWTQQYFNGKEQWIDTSLTGVNGSWQIATYQTGLSDTDFGTVEYGTLSGAIVYTDVIVISEPYIYGVKSHDPVSAPPSNLFKFTPDGLTFVDIGVVTLGGSAIDVDGLALDHDDRLFGFKVSYPAASSQLIQIDKTSAQATAIGPVHTGRDFRGACFDHLGRLLVIDAQEDQLLQMDPDTGQILNTLFQLPSASNLIDITQQRDGTFMIIDITTIYRLTILHGSGVYFEFVEETNPGQDNQSINAVGLAVADFGANPDLLYMFDAGEEDDIYTYEYNYDPATRVTRQTLWGDIINSYNAGRGDLAARPITLLADYPLSQWSTAQGGNNHWYRTVRVLGGITWHEAQAVAENRGGHLATIHSITENNFCYDLVNDDTNLWYFDEYHSGIGPWLGGYELGEGVWLWITGEGWIYTRWAPGEPNNLGGNEAFLHFFSNTGALMNDTWNDIGANIMIHGYIIEWSRPGGPYNLIHFSELSSVWQTNSTELTWRPTWDLDDDGSISLNDLVQFVIDWL